MESFIASLLTRGRMGGVLSILAALGVVVFVILDMGATGSFFLALPPLAFALLIMGIVLLIWGGKGKEIRIKEDAPPPAELTRVLHAQQRPFHFCTRCREVAEGKLCNKCGTRADCLKIETEDDIKMALSAMS